MKIISLSLFMVAATSVIAQENLIGCQEKVRLYGKISSSSLFYSLGEIDSLLGRPDSIYNPTTYSNDIGIVTLPPVASYPEADFSYDERLKCFRLAQINFSKNKPEFYVSIDNITLNFQTTADYVLKKFQVCRVDTEGYNIAFAGQRLYVTAIEICDTRDSNLSDPPSWLMMFYKNTLFRLIFMDNSP
ncbi:MAG: hypothetical protein JST90_18440 [Bacteroidetes bacterium]|nr:hypothetical protein [Bacteroidota bacterium]